MPGSLSLFTVNAVLIMSTDDTSRIFAKYYSPPHPPAGVSATSTDYPGANPYPTVKEQKSFESGLMDKTNKQTNDVILYDNRVVVFKVENDVMLGATDKRTIIENYDLVSLAIDEIIDDGIILETDPVLIASRVSRAPTADTPNMKNIDLSEQGLLNAWEFGRRKLAEQLRQGL
ncbi:hypothetical protein ZTR_03479 [Talaromyces verruculosus]|nr:hypothetical protein ZTR_03479 [Talaromyces verruculosus]